MMNSEQKRDRFLGGCVLAYVGMGGMIGVAVATLFILHFDLAIAASLSALCIFIGLHGMRSAVK